MEGGAPYSSTKQEGTRSSSRHKDPRIVCVSRPFAGKDRHTKVRTVRGIRDRRVRLSVPTALQLYHLQDRLGLTQPSKVVDWLLLAAKHGIDQLPPLQIPYGTFADHLHHLLTSSKPQYSSSVKFNPNPDNSSAGFHDQASCVQVNNPIHSGDQEGLISYNQVVVYHHQPAMAAAEASLYSSQKDDELVIPDKMEFPSSKVSNSFSLQVHRFANVQPCLIGHN